MAHSNLQPTPSPFLKQFHQNTTELESDLPEIDQNLNTPLSKAFVDPWQNTQVVRHRTTFEEQQKSSTLTATVTLIATVEERFVNTLISRDGEHDYVPPTTNLGRKYKRKLS